jgi:hypothetical protein
MEIENALSNYAQEHGGYPGLKRLPVDPGSGWIRMGPALIGGNSGPLKEPNLVNQDDYLDDMKAPDSPYWRYPEYNYLHQWDPPRIGGDGIRRKMNPVDELYREGLYRYIDNPLADPGTAMVNVAYIEYDFNINTNDFVWVNIQNTGRYGLSPGLPGNNGQYTLLNLWDLNDTTTWVNYPAGDFAYIPFNFSKSDGSLAQGYWLIAYGDEKTLVNSPYNKLLQDPNWPTFDVPFDDQDATYVTSYEQMMRTLITGALVVKANVYQDQLGAMM